MVFTTVGLIVGSAGTGWFDLDLESESVSILVEATLVLLLFVDAVRIDVRSLLDHSMFPSRLLAIGLPLTILLGGVFAGWMFPDLGTTEALLLAAVLAPTDAALGQAVVSDKRLPVRVRQGLNVESGLNDGVMVPVVAVLLALSGAGQEGESGAAEWVELVARQVGFGLLCGVTTGIAGGWLLHHQVGRDWVEGLYRQLATVALAAIAFASAEVLGGNGFIAAFVGGLSFGYIAAATSSDVADFTEDEGELLSSITFLVFGAVLAGPLLADIDWRVALYAVLSLTVVRILPVALAFLGSGLGRETKLFAGWFGPRGLASILFALLVAEELENEVAETIVLASVATVLLSVYAHGLTASPWTSAFAGRLRKGPADQPEMMDVPDLPTRRRLG